MPLLLNLGGLKRGTVGLQGRMPVAELEIESRDDLIRFPDELAYDLQGELVGSAVLVQGRLDLALSCTCVRCLKEFVFPLSIPAWTCEVSLEDDHPPVHNDCLDLTPYLREDILLELPQHPLCGSECQGLDLSRLSGVPGSTEASQEGSGVSPWDALDKLKI